MKLLNRNNLFLFLAMSVYAFLSVISLNYCYFWDNIQQISKEAHWFYLTNFSSLLMPAQNSGAEIVATGYHPPLMGLMTATLWKVVGYKLWVSHFFAFVWAIALIYNVRKIARMFFEEKYVGWILLIVVFESSLLTQFTIASPDFILFTAFIISLRAILSHKPYLLSIGIFFLCSINMRGVFVGAIMFVVNVYFSYLQSGNKLSMRSIIKTILPYLPTLALLIAYFISYFINRGWFFSGSATDGHYSMPVGVSSIIKHMAEFVLRSFENGRIVILLLGIYVSYKTFSSKAVLSIRIKTLLLFCILLTGLYLVFVFISQMPFSARYFMPQFFLLTLLVLIGIIKFIHQRRINLIFALILCFELTGNLWIYPDKIAKSWDCTLAHLPYYELREECFDYIDKQKWDYSQISAGFCLSGNRRFAELKNENKTVGVDANRKYFIYSNISNVDDSFAEELMNPESWKAVKEFKKGFVSITIYQNQAFDYKVK